jgi:hypothetical protein
MTSLMAKVCDMHPLEPAVVIMKTTGLVCMSFEIRECKMVTSGERKQMLWSSVL